MFTTLVPQEFGLGCSALPQFSGSSSPYSLPQDDSFQQLQTASSAAPVGTGPVLNFPLPRVNSDPSSSGSFLTNFQSTGVTPPQSAPASVPSLKIKAEPHSSSLSSSSTPAHSPLACDMLLDMAPARKKGKGGRQPALDPRLDPSIDPKRAKRILANRQSAARSKMKQKLLMDGLRSKQGVLAVQREAVAKELCQLSQQCRDLEHDNQVMRCRVQALADQYRIKNALTSRLASERDKLAGAGSPAPPPVSAPAPNPSCSLPTLTAAPPTSLAPTAATFWNPAASQVCDLSVAAMQLPDAPTISFPSAEAPPPSIPSLISAACAPQLHLKVPEGAFAARMQHAHCQLTPMARPQQYALQCP